MRNACKEFLVFTAGLLPAGLGPVRGTAQAAVASPYGAQGRVSVSQGLLCCGVFGELHGPVPLTVRAQTGLPSPHSSPCCLKKPLEQGLQGAGPSLPARPWPLLGLFAIPHGWPSDSLSLHNHGGLVLVKKADGKSHLGQSSRAAGLLWARLPLSPPVFRGPNLGAG